MSLSKGHGHELLPKQASPPWVRWLVRKRMGLTLAGTVVALVIVVRLMAVSNRPANVQAVTAEIGSVAEFWGNPAPNHAGNKIVFQQSTENGVGIFLAGIPNGPRHLIFEQAEKGFDHRNFQVWGWSPDDRWFALSRRPDKESKREIVICDGNTGEIAASIEVDRTVGELAWLTSQAFSYVDDYQELQRVEQLSEKKWSYPQGFKKQVGKKVKLTKEQQNALPKVQGLAALSGDTVMYQQGQAIFSWTFGATEPVLIWEATTNQLVDFVLDLKGKQLLLHCKDGNGEPLASHYLPTKYFTSLGKVPAPDYFTYRVAWFNGNGYAYVRRGIANNVLRVRNSADGGEQLLDFKAGINTYVGRDRALYIVGSTTGEPVAIWRHQVGDETLVCIVSNTMPKFTLAKQVTPTREAITNAAGVVMSFRLWSPVQASGGGKYPVLIGKVGIRWQGYPASVANAGAYFVSIEQDDKAGDWGEEVLPILEHLKSRLNIDAEKVYLYAASGFTPKVNRLLETHSDVWKGAILFSPPAFPDPSKLGLSRLLIDCGGEDFGADAVAKYRDAAAQKGVAVTVAFHENAGHVYRSVASLRARDEAVINFLFGR